MATIAIVAVLILSVAVVRMRQMLRAPAFLYAARLCVRRHRKTGVRRYWRKIVTNFAFVQETVDNDGVVKRIDMWCPNIEREFLQHFVLPEAGGWLEALENDRFQVRREKMNVLGSQFGSIEVLVHVDRAFGARITATRTTLSTT